MRHSLRWRALLSVFLFNSVVFAVLGMALARDQAIAGQRLERQWTEDLVATIEETIAPEGLKVAAILRWPSWRSFSDAVLVDRHLEETPAGTMRASGIDLNPVGGGARPHDFDRGRVLRAVYQAMRGESSVASAGGNAVPIRVGHGVWGGLWYRTRTRAVDYPAVLRELLPWFALSTLLLTGATFLALRRIVLDPVEHLAEGARRMRTGDFSVRLPEPPGRDELAELVRSFNSMSATVQGFNQRLSEEVRVATEKARAAEAAAMRERRLAAMGELAAGLAHEINNPLGGLANAVEELRRPELPPARRAQYLELLARGLERIGETVNRLRRFTPRETPHEPVDLAAVLQDALDLVRHRAERLRVTLVQTVGEGPLRTRGARNELGQAVLNLLVNALDALEEHGTRDPRGPRLELGLRRVDGRVVLAVRDNGLGVAPEQLDKVADLFYTTKEVGRGTGLGLALVHNAMQHHGGEVRITSERGRFFQVELLFPAQGGLAEASGS
ncbi:MAG TPA: HAMP domain-containing sensor histidine kinase [Planctomycetota bacterium]